MQGLCAPALLSLRPLHPPENSIGPRHGLLVHPSRSRLKKLERKWRTMKCRAELSVDAPFAFAIGTCMLSSLVFSAPRDSAQDDSLTAPPPIDGNDTRFAVMGIISLIPYFNWMSWIFAWLDTGSQRYLVYAIVYLAPYLRTNLSLSPEESWLPIASILLCIVHVQIEASIENGDLQSLQFFHEALNVFHEMTGKKGNLAKFSERSPKGIDEHVELPSAHEEMKNRIRSWSDKRKPLEETEHAEGDGDVRGDKNR